MGNMSLPVLDATSFLDDASGTTLRDVSIMSRFLAVSLQRVDIAANRLRRKR